MKRLTSASASLGVLADRAQALGIELLPLIDMKQEPFGASLVGSGQEGADATAESAVRCTEDTDLLLNSLISFKRRQIGRGRIKSTDEGMERLGAGAQTEDGPGATVSPATQRRD